MDRYHRVLRLGAICTLVYAALVLVLASRAGTLGFVTVLGGPVVSVAPGGPADLAGLRAGDVLRAVNGRPTPRTWDVEESLRWLEAGTTLSLSVERAMPASPPVIHAVVYRLPRQLPLASGAGAVLAAALMLLALIADRGGDGPPRSFYRSTVVYAVFLVGTFAWETVLRLALLALPWLYGMALAAPVTCHFMLQFPAGPAKLSRRLLCWLYAPPLLLAASQTFLVLAFRTHLLEDGQVITWMGARLNVALAAVYLTVGAVSRARRLRRKRAEIDPVAARWLHAGGAVMAGSLLAGGVAAAVDMTSFVGGGFRPYVALAMVGGSVCLVLAMTRTRFGDLDRTLRRGTGAAVANAVAAALYLAIIVGLSGAEVLTPSRALVALASTALALVLFGPLRGWIRRITEDRLADERTRARGMLKRTAEASVMMLDVKVLQRGIVLQVAPALSAEGAALYEAIPDPDPVPDDDHGGAGRWLLAHATGKYRFAPLLEPGDPLAVELDRRVARASAAFGARGMLASPIPVAGPPLVLVIAPSEDRPLDDEDREVVETLCAGLAVAVANARAHTELRALSERLKDEVQLAEKRRREIARLKDRIEEEKVFLEAELTRRGGGRAPVIGAGLRPTYDLVQKVARSEAAVLVSGETGVGKELVARAIHAGSSRRGGPFVVVDCGAIAATLFESTLFGHEKGAFTGATRAALGAFRAAHGGTIFLDEIGELPLDLQPKLLRVLQEKEVLAVGGERPVPIDVRVVAGTNRELAVEAATGRFREDLLYRLRVVEIAVPPLRARRKDIPELAEAFLRELAGRRGLPPKRLADDAALALAAHDWPGNVRELEHALEAAALYAPGEEIHVADLPMAGEVFRRRAGKAVAASGLEGGGPGLRQTLEGLEKERLMQALRDHDGNRTAAAKALGLSRGALLRRIERYGVDA